MERRAIDGGTELRLGETRDGIGGCKRHAQGGASEGARREVRGSGRITQSSGRSDVEVSSLKEAFDHFIGKGGRRGTKRFHERLIRKVDVQVADICFRVSLPETPEDAGEEERFRRRACGRGGDLSLIYGGGPQYMIESAKNTERDAERPDPQNRVKGRETRMAVKLNVYCPLARMCRIVMKAIEAERRTRDGNPAKVARGQKRQDPEDFHHRRKTVHGG